MSRIVLLFALCLVGILGFSDKAGASSSGSDEGGRYSYGGSDEGGRYSYEGSDDGGHYTYGRGKGRHDESGSVFVRWGRPDCGEYSELVYSGRAAGSKHRDLNGGGSNILCVPHEPTFVNPAAGESNTRAYLFAIEHQVADFPLYQPYHLQDVSCAVCMATERHAHLMIPGKNDCPSNKWNLEYEGFLMAERSHELHQKSTFICVDRHISPVPDTGGASSARGALLDFVESKCSVTGGGLPCDKFTAGYEMTCAVCTR